MEQYISELNELVLESINNQYDISYKLEQSTIDQLGISTNTTEFTQSQIIKAKEINESSDLTVLYPSDNIDSLLMEYSSLNPNDKFTSDSKCLEIFNMDNTELYNLLKLEIKITNESSLYEIGKRLIQLEQSKPSDMTTDVRNKIEKQKLLNRIRNSIDSNRIKWEFSYSPYFSPKEIIQLENHYSDTRDEKYDKIFEEYNNYYNGYNNNFNIIEWKNEVAKLQFKLDATNDEYYKECMVRLGWNPEIPFNEKTQIKAKERLEYIINESYKNSEIIDISDQVSSFDESTYIIQESTNSKLKPISVVLVKGSSFFSNVITTVTKGEFSHSAICIDDNFSKLYSFNLDNKLNHAGGFSLENINTYPKENRVSIFTFFVTEDIYKKISDVIQGLIYDIKNTTYGIGSILTFPFKHINLNMPEHMICSQFVDKILKLANFDITNIDSSKVSPNYLYNVAIKNSKIYKVFDGLVKDFNNSKASKFIDRMSKKAKPVNESFNPLYEYCINQSLYPVISEAKSFPIQFNNKGDMLVNLPMVDYDAEYSASHKLLLNYEKINNIEGMKYELAKLYYINYILEKELNSKNCKNRNKYIKTRARVINDFKKYLVIVLEQDKDFNFYKYYEDSQWYPHTVEVKNSTMKQFKNIISYIL